MRGATGIASGIGSGLTISIHAPHAGCDSLCLVTGGVKSGFQSTHPMRGATASTYHCSKECLISIHAPHAGCDLYVPKFCGVYEYISIHAPHAGCDDFTFHIRHIFLHFNPRTPCGVRPLSSVFPLPRRAISIHAPHAGCDHAAFQSPVKTFFRFQSTHPMRGATSKRRYIMYRIINFNPRTPCGVRRRCLPDVQILPPHFNPRTPCGVRLKRGYAHRLAMQISIHAPHAGCDFGSRGTRQDAGKFQSTHPMRGATWSAHLPGCLRGHFNPRTPCGVRHPTSVPSV